MHCELCTMVWFTMKVCVRAGNPRRSLLSAVLGPCWTTCRPARCPVAVHSLAWSLPSRVFCHSAWLLRRKFPFFQGISCYRKVCWVRDGSIHLFNVSRGPVCPSCAAGWGYYGDWNHLGIQKLTWRIDQCVKSFRVTCSSCVVPTAVFYTVIWRTHMKKVLLKIRRHHGQSREVINFAMKEKQLADWKDL